MGIELGSQQALHSFQQSLTLWCENMDSEWILVITYLSNQIISSPAGEVSSGRWNRKAWAFLASNILAYWPFPELWEWRYPGLAEVWCISVARESVQEARNIWFIPCLFLCWLTFVSILEDPLYDAEDKRNRGGMNFSTAGAEARGHSGHCDSSGLCHLSQEEKIHCNEL